MTIQEKYISLGGVNGFLGRPKIFTEGVCRDQIGRFVHYANGSIFSFPATGVWEVHGAIRDKWFSIGTETSFLGYPLTDECTTPDGRGRYNHFQGGSIYYTPEYGAYIIHGLIRGRWADLGWERSSLGYPVSDESPLPNAAGRYNVFEHGIITWSPGQSVAQEGPHHYERIYGQVRAQILSRFFAVGPGGRRNYSVERNRLQDPALGTPPPAKNTFVNLTQRQRWNIEANFGENPQLYGSLLHVMLAVEHDAGNAESSRVLQASLATLDSLQQWLEPGVPESRLPVRWDAGSPTDNPPGFSKFLFEQNGSYSTGLSSTDINHFPIRDARTLADLLGPARATDYLNGQFEYYQRYRRWEQSMDELVGIITSYWIVGKLSHDPGLTAAVKTQSARLGNYLADNGYILVRPMGGVALQGAMGMLPALEHPFSRAVQSAAGNGDFHSRADFRQAMEKAGYWRQLVGPITAWQVAGWALVAPLPILEVVLEGLGVGSGGIPAIMAGQVVSPSTLGTAAALAQHPDCFDCLGATDAAAAVIGKELPDKRAFYQTVVELSAQFGKLPGAWFVNFHSFIGLTGVDDADSTVRDTFTAWYNLRRLQPALETKGLGSSTIFSSGVATLVSADLASENRLVQDIERGLVELFRDCYFDPQLPVYYGRDEDSDPGYYWECARFPYWVGAIGPASPLDLLAGLALAFWHARRKSAVGSSPTAARFPAALQAARFAQWPPVAVPAGCVDLLKNTAEIQGSIPPQNNGSGFNLFNTPLVPRAPLPAPAPFPVNVLLGEVTVTIRATDRGDVLAGVMLHPGQEIEISAAATNTIWAGAILDPRNGPGGIPGRFVDDARWPLHTGLNPGATAFCLLGRLNGYFKIGEHLPRTRWRYHRPQPLFLRINDNAPGDGDGHFNVRIQVWASPGTDRNSVFYTPDILRDGGTLSTSESADDIGVTVELGAVPPGQVEFVLKTADNITWRKEILITSSTGATNTISTQDATHEAHNGLYQSELAGATLTFKKMKPGGGVWPVRTLNISNAIPGSRLTFIWDRD